MSVNTVTGSPMEVSLIGVPSCLSDFRRHQRHPSGAFDPWELWFVE
jgi:hypothetical protein